MKCLMSCLVAMFWLSAISAPDFKKAIDESFDIDVVLGEQFGKKLSKDIEVITLKKPIGPIDKMSVFALSGIISLRKLGLVSMQSTTN